MTGKQAQTPVERFQELVWPVLPVLVRTARYLTGNAAAADDLVQETMLRALRHFGSYAERSSIKPWLLTILRRTHIDLYRAGRRHQADVSLDASGLDRSSLAPASSPPDLDLHDAAQLLERFEDQAVIDALKTLPQEICWTLLLVDVEGLDQADAAEILQVPVGTVKSRAHRGRQMLRAKLGEFARERGWLKNAGE
ncbi:MAG: sigma-70 family RNA polymerase sigma factor [Phycisphaeraceae bacterium]|nr:sigma-70 family RNA polymerase sigma factor [Phycisphaeraceae bacterium]